VKRPAFQWADFTPASDERMAELRRRLVGDAPVVLIVGVTPPPEPLDIDQ
jgi:hypothetical protein